MFYITFILELFFVLCENKGFVEWKIVFCITKCGFGKRKRRRKFFFRLNNTKIEILIFDLKINKLTKKIIIIYKN